MNMIDRHHRNALYYRPIIDNLSLWNRHRDIELSQTGEAVIVTAHLPGIDPNQIQVSVTPTTVHLSGRQQYRHQNRYQHTLTIQSFERTLSLPVRVNDQQVIIDTSRGELTLTLPKARGGPSFWNSPSPSSHRNNSETHRQIRDLQQSVKQTWRSTKQWLGHQLHRAADYLLK